jgi:hypothetical protein
MGVYPYANEIDKYWKYENADPSTAHYGTNVAKEIFSEIQDKIKKRGRSIYHVRAEAIIVQDLYHEVIRQLADMLTEHIKDIEQYEKENSGDITNYFDPEKEEKEQNDENEENEQKEGSGSL